MTVHPLRPATHHRHGGPLPHHLANGPRAHLPAGPWPLSCLALVCMASHPVLSCVSTGYPRLVGRLPTCYSPVRRSRIATTARLACLKRAASVRSEPGSNSPSFKTRSEDRMIYRSILSTPHPPGCSPNNCTLSSVRIFELTGSPQSFQISSFLRYACKELYLARHLACVM